MPWIVWENVPGALSANGGDDFATFLSLLSGCEVTPPDKGFGTAGFVCNARRDRYGLAWRVLDAQFTRVSGFPNAIPQRRRRLFVVGHFGSWESAAEVLLEPGRVSWPTPTRRKTRQTAPAPAGISLEIPGGTRDGVISCYENHANDSRVTFSGDVAPVLTSRSGTGGGNLPLVLSGTDLFFDVGNGQVDCSMHPLYECASTLHCMHDANAVMCVPINSMIIGKDVIFGDRQTIGIGEDGDALPTIGAKHHHAVAVASFVGRQGSKAGGIGYAEEVTPTVRASQDIHIVVAAFMGGQGGQEGGICFNNELCPTVKASPSLVPDIVVIRMRSGKEGGGKGALLSNDLSLTLTAENDQTLVVYAIAENVIGRAAHNGGNGVGAKYEVAYTLDTAGVQGVAVDVVDKQGTIASDVVPCLTATTFMDPPSIRAFGYVRRLLPIECERLMGFPDNHTRIPWNGKSEENCPDSPRYKACGNSMAVNCMRWIGEQIQIVENGDL